MNKSIAKKITVCVWVVPAIIALFISYKCINLFQQAETLLSLIWQ